MMSMYEVVASNMMFLNLHGSCGLLSQTLWFLEKGWNAPI